MIYVNCPLCGHKLMEGDEGSRVQVKCHKCGKILLAELTKENITVTLKENKTEEIKASN